MFNLSKENTKDKVEALASKSEDLVSDASQAVKGKAREVAVAIDDGADKAKNEANDLISSLKDLINDYSKKSKITQLKEQISDKALGLKTAVSSEVSTAYATSKQKTCDAIKENPLGSLALVAGAALVLGYIFGTRNSDK